MSGTRRGDWLSWTMPLVSGAGIVLGGPWIAIGPVYLLVALPLFDLVGGHDFDNPVPERVRERAAGRDAVLWSWVPLQLAFIALVVSQAGDATWGERLAMGFAGGLVTGAGGITVAHELMHRANTLAKQASELLMASVSYGHFCTEHIGGHHRRVATELDPATSRLNESLYAFWWRSILGGWKSARALDRAWSNRHPDRMKPWTRRRILWMGLAGGAYVVGDLEGVLVFGLQSLFAVLLLETINYIEHYGLVRRTQASGRYERVQPHHSWNASHRLTNRFLFNLQRHSDHHASAHRPHWALRHFDEVPQLPFSYPTAFVVALVPPLWRRIMNPRVAAWEASHG
ncbi:MAG: alkane 1-monooxygenase [Myxococcota bacterium]